MKTVIEMAGQAFETPGTELAFRNDFWTVTQEELERFADLVISHKLDEIADKVEQDFKQSFGADTCASWASWIRGQK